jgi:hypothetical protein
MLSVGLYAPCEPGPALPAGAVVQYGRELDKVVWLGRDGMGSEPGTPVGHLGGELVAVAEGVSVLPSEAARRSLSHRVGFVETLEESAVVSARTGQSLPSSPGGTLCRRHSSGNRRSLVPGTSASRRGLGDGTERAMLFTQVKSPLASRHRATKARPLGGHVRQVRPPPGSHARSPRLGAGRVSA